jgi:hypothetical protein
MCLCRCPFWYYFGYGIVVAQYAGLSNTAASWFVDVYERNVTSFAEEGKRQVSVCVKGWMVKHSFVGPT